MPTSTAKIAFATEPLQPTFIDYDPLVDLNLTVTIKAIRALDIINLLSDPDFFVKIIINGIVMTSPIWPDMIYLYDCYTVTVDIPDDKEFVDITIQLWESDDKGNTLCDISEAPNRNGSGLDVHLRYDVRVGRWSGDNNIGDITGYGRVCGSTDGSIYTNEKDCEVWFDISQNDFDTDGLPYWIETMVYGTDPTMADTGSDRDGDGIPIEWEHHFGYNPLVWDDHVSLDPEGDSLNNREEFLTYGFGTDPFRKDVLLEIDYMQESDGQVKNVSAQALEFVKTPFHRRDIVFHFDIDEPNGGEIIPYDAECSFEEIRAIWNTYFMHNIPENWRRGVFHYAVFVHDQTPKGYGFSGDVSPYWGYIPGTDSFAIANTLVEKKSKIPFLSVDFVTASLIVHEIGHNFGIRFGEPFGCDNRLTNSPFKVGWYIWRNYKSIMNYRYTYTHLDYSDGSHGKRDYDDWDHIDLTYFEKPI